MKQIHIALVVILFTSVIIALRFSLLRLWGYPRSITNKSEINGDNISGQYAWDFLHRMVNNTHTYCSQENLKIRQLIIDEIKSIQNMQKSMDCTTEFQLEYDTTNMFYYGDYFESNNVLLRVKGNSSDALLVSAHYDSVDFSMGITDDGIGIASMMSSIYSLALKTCKNQLETDIIFNFNNGEELGLYGGMAFTLHPWFNNVKGFINLEGTGGAGYERSLLFRTNHYSLNYKLMHSTPFVHASIMAQEIVGKFSASITDWEVYGARGVPGSDYAFYTNRYVYHSTRDDFEHASVYATQYMADNLYAGILSIANDHNFLSSLQNEPSSYSDTPNFFFYDVAGIVAIMYSKTVFFVFSSMVIALLIGVVFAGGFLQGKNITNWAFYKPYIFGCTYTIVFWILSLAGVGLLSMARNSINKGSTYGMSLLAYFSSVFLIFGIGFGMNCLLEKYHQKLYKPLPESIETGLNSSVTGLNNEDFHDSDSRLNENGIMSTEKQELADILFGSNLIFWALITILTIVITAQELMISYFLFDWTYYYAAGYFVSLLKVFEKFRWVVILVVSLSIPLLVSVDLSHMFIMFFPSSLVEGLPSYIVDLFFVLPIMLFMTNLLPIFAKLQTFYPSMVCFFVFLVLWICGCSIFPYSSEQPVHITPVQVWDVTTPTSAKAGFIRYGLSILGFPAIMDPSTWASKAKDSLPLDYNATMASSAAQEWFYGPQIVFGMKQYPLGLDSTANISNLINATVEKLNLNGNDGWQLNITGSPNSRYCGLIAKQDYKTVFKINEEQTWTAYQDRPIDYYGSIGVYRRGLQNNQMRIHVLNNSQSQLHFDVYCMYTISEQSPEAQGWLSKLPSWTTPRGRPDGSLEVWKSFSIPVQ